MTMRFLALLAVLLLATPALGQSAKWNTKPDSSGTSIATGSALLQANGRQELYYHFADLGVVDSDPITVQTKSVVFCLNPATDSDGADLATVWIRKSIGNEAPATDNYSPRILDAALTGLAGAAGTQNACVRAGPGQYYVEVVNDGTSDGSYVSATAEND